MERKDQFKKLGDADAARRNRHETTVAIRKAKKEEHLAARRKMDATGTAEPGGGDANSPATGGGAGRTQGLSEKMQERLAMLPQMVAGIYSNDRVLVLVFFFPSSLSFTWTSLRIVHISMCIIYMHIRIYASHKYICTIHMHFPIRSFTHGDTPKLTLLVCVCVCSSLPLGGVFQASVHGTDSPAAVH